MVCTSIIHQPYERCKEIIATAEMAELRMDLLDLSDNQLIALLSEANIPTIVTCHESSYSNKYTEQERIALLKLAVDAGTAYIDVDLESESKLELVAYAHSKGCKVIVSYHNDKRTPSLQELQYIEARCRSYNPDIVKLVGTANAEEDNAEILSLYGFSTIRKEKDLVAFAMGEKGRISRLACLYMGAPHTYASAEHGMEAAGGQLTADEMRRCIAILSRNV